MSNTFKSILITTLLLSFFSLQAQSQEDLQNLLNETSEVQSDSSQSKVKKKKSKEKTEKQVKGNNEKKSKTKDVDVVVEDVEDTNSGEKLKGSVAYFKRKGDAASKAGAHFAAMNNYQEALLRTKKKKRIAKLSMLAGESAFFIRDYVLAENYFSTCLNQNRKKKVFDQVHFHLANSLKHQGKYREAKQAYTDFIKVAADNKSLSRQFSKARIASKGCTYALSLTVEDPAYKVLHPGEEVNGPYADFGPEIRGNELIYSKILSECTDEQSSVSKIFSAEMYNDKYNLAQDFSKVINAGDDFVCNPSFTADGKIIYFAKCQMDGKNKSTCNIYTSRLKNGVWAEAQKLGEEINQEGSSSSHPQIVLDENNQEILYFSSDRESGRGGKDIWYAYQKEDGGFGRARNAGSSINTRFDDVSPFYHTESQTLYFSSDGRVGLGGLDIFACTKIEDNWSEAVNLETPVNSSLDDYDFVLDEKGDRGFLVSNREGTISMTGPTCCDDIFEVRSTKIELFVSSLVYVEGNEGRKVMDQGEIVLENINSGQMDTMTFEGENRIFPLNLESDYSLFAYNGQFEANSVEFDTYDMIKSDTLYYDLFLTDQKEIEQEKKEFLGIIYYEYAESKLTPDAPATLQSIIDYLNAHPKTLIEVSAHTDDKGPAAFNLALSKKRCEAAANFLKSEGIEMFRIKKKWYGESQPAAPNTNEDGSDNPEGRAKNRRTEFKITEAEN